MTERITIPQNIDLEKKILSAMIVDGTGHMDAMPILKLPEMFYHPAHQAVFKAIQDLSNENRPIDLVTVNQQLAAMGLLEKAGGTYALAQLTDHASSAAHIEEWSRILVQYWLRRELIKNADRIKALAFRDDEDSLQVLERAALLNDQLNDILYSGGKRKTWSENLDGVVERVRMLSSQTEDELSGVPTGLKKADKFTGGWQSSDLVIMAARPGMGKTSMVLKNFVTCGLEGIPAGFFSLEMSGYQLASRSVAINSNFHLTQLVRDGFTKAQYFVTLKDKTEEMKQFPLLIDDTPGLDIRDLVARARIWKRQHGIKILFIDYLQLVNDKANAGRGGNREQEISSISRKLKGLAKELDIPVIALSQLSRAVETRGGSKRPLLSDLRESGAIEQDADIVTFLYRPEYYKIDIDHEEMEEFCNAEFIFAKHRGGSLGTIDVYFQADKAKYSDYDEHAKYKAENNVDDSPFTVPQGDPDIAF